MQNQKLLQDMYMPNPFSCPRLHHLLLQSHSLLCGQLNSLADNLKLIYSLILLKKKHRKIYDLE